ncbi:MAG TPA: hypothetical protein VEK36_00255, partial [Candidatus Paceibacterota bacterium]|nr:hypothetical protein [Candidatus Paceibacterota bacterium]
MDEPTALPQDFKVEQLPSISTPPSPNRVDMFMNKINHPRSKRVLKWLIALALVLFLVAVARFWFGRSSFAERDVVLLLEGPSQASSGDEVTYKLKYRNNTRVDLTNMEFRFFYPDDSIVITEGTFSDDLSHGFTVDKLSPGQEGTLELKAFLVGDKGNIKTAKVNLIFKAGSFKSLFEKSESVATTIINVPVPMTLVAPPTAVSGQDISYILDYRNETDADVADLRFEFSYPDGFLFKKVSPSPTSSNNVWDVASVKKGTGSRITITGTLTGQERESKNIAVVLKRKLNDQYVNYERATSSTIISSPLITASLSVNGSRDTITYPGDTLLYTIQYRNNSSYSLVGMNLTAKLEGEMFDLSTLDTRGGYYDSSAKTITFNAGVVPDFGTFNPGKSGQINFQVRLKPTLPGLLGSSNYSVKVIADLSTPNVPTGVDGDQVSTEDVLITKISTQPAFNSALYFQDPVYGSSGPMPPQVGQQTIFTVHWQITNPGNDMNSAVVKATLPPGVAWENVASVVGAPVAPIYDKNKAQVIWNIGVLPAGAKYEGIFRI